jgi:hypothetical protein
VRTSTILNTPSKCHGLPHYFERHIHAFAKAPLPIFKTKKCWPMKGVKAYFELSTVVYNDYISNYNLDESMSIGHSDLNACRS